MTLRPMAIPTALNWYETMVRQATVVEKLPASAAAWLYGVARMSGTVTAPKFRTRLLSRQMTRIPTPTLGHRPAGPFR